MSLTGEVNFRFLSSSRTFLSRSVPPLDLTDINCFCVVSSGGVSLYGSYVKV